MKERSVSLNIVIYPLDIRLYDRTVHQMVCKVDEAVKFIAKIIRRVGTGS